MTTALMVTTGLEHVLEGVDFSSINNVISTLASMDTSNISEFDRKNAITLIGEWEGSVIDKISKYHEDMKAFADYFSPTSTTYFSDAVTEDMRRQIAAAVGLTDLINEFYEKLDIYEAFLQNPPTKHIDEFEMTAVDCIKEENRYAGEAKIYKMKCTRMSNELAALNKEFVVALSEKPEAVALVKKAKLFVRNSKKFKDQCSDKAMSAKANVLIGDAALKAALKEMVEFAVKL